MFSIEYKLTGPGWAELKIISGNQKVTCVVSYLYDTLLDLIKSALDLLQNKKNTSVTVLDEPGEYRLLLEKDSFDNIILTIDKSEDWNPEQNELTTVFKTTVKIQIYVQEVKKVAKYIFETYGEDGYKKLWIEHTFPLNEYYQLQKSN